MPHTSTSPITSFAAAASVHDGYTFPRGALPCTPAAAKPSIIYKLLFSGIAAALCSSFSFAPANAGQSSDFGCQVLLCLSNPGGPTQFAECVLPITKLYQQLAKGKPFPTCTMSGGAGSNGQIASSPRYGTQPYEDCPAGYVAESVFIGKRTGDICYRDKMLSELGGAGYQLKQGESYVINGVAVDNLDTADLSLPGVMVRQRVNAALRAQPNYIEYTLNGETKRSWW